MSDYRDTKTDVFMHRIAQIIDARTGTFIGSSLIKQSAYPLRVHESFHRFIGRVMRIIRYSFDRSISDRIIIRLQETPESLYAALLCLAMQSSDPIEGDQSDLDVSQESLKAIESVFSLFVLLASTYEPDQIFDLFEKRRELAPL